MESFWYHHRPRDRAARAPPRWFWLAHRGLAAAWSQGPKPSSPALNLILLSPSHAALMEVLVFLGSCAWRDSGVACTERRVFRADEVDGTIWVQGSWWGKRCGLDCILKWVGNNTGYESIIRNLRNQQPFFLVNMKAGQLHPLTRAQPTVVQDIMAPSAYGSRLKPGLAFQLLAGWNRAFPCPESIQVVVAFTLELMPTYPACAHSLMWPHIPGQGPLSQDPVQAQLASLRGDVWVIFLSESSPAQSPHNLCYTREFCLFWRLGPHTGLKQVQRNICHCTKTCLLFCSLRRTDPSLFFAPPHVLPQLPTSFVDKSLCGNWLVYFSELERWPDFLQEILGESKTASFVVSFLLPSFKFFKNLPMEVAWEQVLRRIQ